MADPIQAKKTPKNPPETLENIERLTCVVDAKCFGCAGFDDDGDAAARYTLEQARIVLRATNAAKKSAAWAHTPYKWVCELISPSL